MTTEQNTPQAHQSAETAWSRLATTRTRIVQRLAGRGRLTVTLDLRNKVIRREWDGHTETTWWSDTPTPVWVVHLARPVSRRWNPSLRFFMAIIGWDDVRVENEDLDAALAEALEKSEPHRVYLEERVWEHEDFKRAADLAAQFEVYADAV